MLHAAFELHIAAAWHSQSCVTMLILPKMRPRDILLHFENAGLNEERKLRRYVPKAYHCKFLDWSRDRWLRLTSLHTIES